MKSLTSLTALALLLFSCASDTEKSVLEDIATVYNGETSYSKSFVSNTTEKRTTFNVFIQNSAMIDTLAPSVTTANSALMVYDALTSEEKENYSDIEIYLINAQKDTASYYYPMTALLPISHKNKVFKAFSDALVNRDYEALNSIDKSKEIPVNLGEQIKNGFQNLEKKYGTLKEYHRFGIAEEKDNIGTIYQYQGYLTFANGHNMNYLLVVDATPKQDQIVGYKFFQ